MAHPEYAGAQKFKFSTLYARGDSYITVDEGYQLASRAINLHNAELMLTSQKVVKEER